MGNLTLTSDFAEAIFPNISGGRNRNDASILAVMRALLPERMPDGENICVSFPRSSFSKDVIKNITSLRKFFDEERNGEYTSTLVIHSLENDEENNIGLMKNVRDVIAKRDDKEFETLDLISEFFERAQFKAEFIINRSTKTTVVLISNLGMKATHLLGSIVPVLLPWYFGDIDRRPEGEEVDLLKTLTQKTPADFQERIEKFAEKFDFRTARIKTLLKGFETVVERAQLGSVERAIRDCDRHMQECLERHATYLRDRENHEVRLLGLQQKIASGGDSEIMEYFLCNSKLHIADVYEGTLTFIAEGYLDEYDPEIFDRVISNTHSVFYNYHDDKYTKEDVAMLLKAIWGEDSKLKIKTCAAYRLDLNNMSLSGVQGFDFPPSFVNYLPNQHIQQYQCTGNFSEQFAICMREHNYIGAIEQCVASCRNINMGDSTVCQAFMQKIFSSSAKRFIELPDGTLCTPFKALEWLKNGENTETEEVSA